jgi:ornithine carbamoyltransferase
MSLVRCRGDLPVAPTLRRVILVFIAASMTPPAAFTSVSDHEQLHTPLRGRDFLSMRDLSREEVLGLFERARHMKAEPLKYSTALTGQTLAMIFEKPSLRTRVSFDVGMTQLGGHALELSGAISLGHRESLHDVARNLERMVQAIMVRTFAHESLEQLAAYASVPVINGLTDFSHPCQALADFLTMLEVCGRLEGLEVAYVGDGNNVAHSLMFGAALLGCHLRIGTPEGYAPHPGVTAWVRSHAPATGATLTLTHVPEDAVAGADIVYTDVWASMGQEDEAVERRRTFLPFQVNERLFGLARRDARFMHCLPAHRGEEVTDAVIDDNRSVVFHQAENRLHAEKALLFALMK